MTAYSRRPWSGLTTRMALDWLCAADYDPAECCVRYARGLDRAWHSYRKKWPPVRRRQSLPWPVAAFGVLVLAQTVLVVLAIVGSASGLTLAGVVTGWTYTALTGFVVWQDSVRRRSAVAWRRLYAHRWPDWPDPPEQAPATELRT
jgi:hypothetical protein